MIPRATYRLQFHKDFTFAAARRLAPYLKRLGISHVYVSPILKARPGSIHGYDVTDPAVINPELGGEEGFREFASVLSANGIGIILDIVPNHMAVHADNHWWMDVLRNGPSSAFANFFDIDWDALDGKVLVPVLGSPYWETLQTNAVSVIRDGRSSELRVRYFDWSLPLRSEDQEVDPAQFATPEELHTLLERQHYRLAWWRTTNDAINWRRFFDVPDLIALKQEHQGVFEATHAKILELYENGLVDGLRVDHVDGLADPASYCHRLRAALEERDARRRNSHSHAYLVVEKILGQGESLPSDWNVDGTTGYDFMNQASAVQHAAAGAEPLARLWSEISGRAANFEDEEIPARREIAQGSFKGALTRTTRGFFVLAQSEVATRDIGPGSVRRALLQLLENLRIYRTYQDKSGLMPELQFAQALAAAKEHLKAGDRKTLDFVSGILRASDQPRNRDTIRRFNQLSAPVAAKAVEDTAFYRYGRQLSRNDVGFIPAAFSMSITEFHEVNRARASTFPNALLATATHDHKRGEDARARLAVLSEVPEYWARAVAEWFELNARHRPAGLDPGDEYQLYQTLAGAWPLDLRAEDAVGLSAFCERVLAWQQKSLREAKLRTSWLDPETRYEKATEEFVGAILDPVRAPDFLQSLKRFVEIIAPGGALNGLVQAALRCTAPGIPDCYQGTEFWDFSLVDPDNRRPVDYAAREHAIGEDIPLVDLLSRWRDGRIKQRLIATLLNLRTQNAELFAEGAYLPQATTGARSEHVLAFMRRCDHHRLLVAVPLHMAMYCRESPIALPEAWADTAIVPSEAPNRKPWRNVLEGGREYRTLACRELFSRFPVAVMI